MTDTRVAKIRLMGRVQDCWALADYLSERLTVIERSPQYVNNKQADGSVRQYLTILVDECLPAVPTDGLGSSRG